MTLDGMRQIYLDSGIDPGVGDFAQSPLGIAAIKIAKAVQTETIEDFQVEIRKQLRAIFEDALAKL